MFLRGRVVCTRPCATLWQNTAIPRGMSTSGKTRKQISRKKNQKNVDYICRTNVGISRCRPIVSSNVTELSAGPMNHPSSVKRSQRSGAVFIIIFIQTISPQYICIYVELCIHTGAEKSLKETEIGEWYYPFGKCLRQPSVSESERPIMDAL